jgi:hypothetical protein
VYEQAGVTTNLTVGRRYVMGTVLARCHIRGMPDIEHSYLDQLEKRLNDIETTLSRAHHNQTTTLVDNTPILVQDRLRGNQDGTAKEGKEASPAPASLLYQGNGAIGELDMAEDSIDGMGAIKFTDEQDWGYFGKKGQSTPPIIIPNSEAGPSSNIAFLRHISLAMARVGDVGQALTSPSERAHEVAGGMSVSRPHPVDNDVNTGRYNRLHGSVNIYALPPEARMWGLIKEYFQKTGQLLPYVHEQSFCATYFEMRESNFTMARRTWLGLLNIILAMATTLHVETSISSEKRIEESDVYYQRANGLCDKESRRNISLELGT